ncbi:hypothetical protein HN873_008977, partial [Arachis hypogaea]
FLCCHLFCSTTLLSALRTSPQSNSSYYSFLACSKLPWRSPFIWCTSPCSCSQFIPSGIVGIVGMVVVEAPEIVVAPLPPLPLVVVVEAHEHEIFAL